MSKYSPLFGFELQSFFAHARTALWYGLQQLPVESGQTMLVPDYICEAVLHPLDDLGIRTVFYPVDDSFVPDWEVLEALQGGEPAHAFLIVHYFGQPQDIERARDFCNQHGLWLIEDNSHGHGGSLNGSPLGSFGDLGFSSPRKQLQSASGGILYLHGKPADTTQDGLCTYPVSGFKQSIRSLVSPFPSLKGMLRQVFRSEPDFTDHSAFPEIRMAYYRADPVSSQRILSENWREHAASRREAWRAWSQVAVGYGLQPIWKEPHPESCPWLLPVYASNRKLRLSLLRSGWRKGLNFSPWPHLPESVSQSSPSTVDRWQSLLCFPLHQKPKILDIKVS